MRDNSRSALVFRSGGGFLMLFGTPFFLAGLAMIGAAAAGVLKPAENNWVGYLVGAVFALLGSVFMFGRHEVVFEPLTRTWWKKWSWLGLGKKSGGSVDEFHEVHLTREVRSNGKNSTVVYPLRLIRKNGGKKLTIATKRSFDAARPEAERIAKVLRFPLHESTGGGGLVTEPGDLDLSFRDKVSQGKFAPNEVEAPANLKSTVKYQHGFLRATMKVGGTMDIIIGVALLTMVPFMGAVMFGGGFAGSNLDAGGVPIFMLVFGFAALLPFLIGLGIIFRALMARESVEISMDRVKHIRTMGPITKVREMAGTDIEDVWIRTARRSHPEIYLRGDKEYIAFGGGLKNDERLYLLCLAQKVLSGNG